MVSVSALALVKNGSSSASFSSSMSAILPLWMVTVAVIVPLNPVPLPTVSATGYEKSLTFALTVGGSEAPTPEPAPEPTPTPEPDPEPTPEPEPPVADPALKAGTYTAESTCSDGNYFDYKITATVVVGEDGLIQSLAAEANEDASKNDKSFLADALEGMSAKLVGLNRAGYLDWSENYTGKGGSTAYDAVSGATYSSNSIQNAVAAAMKTAVSES